MARAKLQEEFLTDEEDQDVVNLEAEAEQEELPTEEASPEPLDIPEKYQGKSIQELVEMHMNAEKHIGRQSSEVGELRRTVDEFIKSQTPSTQQEEAPSEVDFFADPKAAFDSYIENHPKFKEIEQNNKASRKAAVEAMLNKTHPDWQQVLAEPSFVEWVKASNVRLELFSRADQFDFDAANELVSNYKERKGVAQQTAELDKQTRKQQVKSASTGQAKASAEPSRKRKYRRTQIIKQMKDDPDAYLANADEYLLAYAEGRVI